MDVNKIKEELSISYISTVSAKAGIDYEIIRHDQDSADGLLKKWIDIPGIGKYNASLRVQLKATSSVEQYREYKEELSYKLKVKNYNDLTLPATVPIILGLLVLPENQDEWITWSSEELIVKGCMYWACFAGKAQSENSGSITVRILKQNVINSESLLKLLERTAQEEQL